MKRATVIAAVLTGLFMAGLVNAGERTFGDGTLPSFLEIYDLDGDGVLSEEEKQAMQVARRERHEEWVDRWDTDGNGVISDEEREAARVRLRDQIEECRIDRFNDADTDGDGFLSFEEFSDIPAVQRLAEKYPDKPALIFARLDTDDDELVSLEEFMSHLRPPRPRPSDSGGGEDGRE